MEPTRTQSLDLKKTSPCQVPPGGRTSSCEARTPLSSDGGGCFTRDSGIFDAGHSSNASNPNCSSSDVSSPLSSSTQPQFQVSGAACLKYHPQMAFGEPANILPQSKLNFLALKGSADVVTDSEMENELNLRSVPVLKCLPSERLKQQEKHSKRAQNLTCSRHNDFSGLTIESDLNSRANFQHPPPLFDRPKMQVGSPDSAKMDRKGFMVPLSVGSLVSPVKYPADFTVHTKSSKCHPIGANSDLQFDHLRREFDVMQYSTADSMAVTRPSFATSSQLSHLPTSPNSPKRSVKEKRPSAFVNVTPSSNNP